MLACMKKILILVCVLTLALPLYAQESESPPKKDSTEVEVFTSPLEQQKKTTNSFLEFIGAKAYAATLDEKEEKEMLREEWKKLLGIDIFYPYFKAKEVQDLVSEKASVEFLKIKGRPKFENNRVQYIFKIKF